MYSGEWREDRRHGHGVLDVRGHYKFYGQWDNNARTGYGVAVYSDRRKEEGLWQNGKLINVLKHKKLAVLKGHQMEGKVKQAHTLALQAAEEARNKSMLAEARAAHSEAKARSAMRVVMQAVQDMQHARDKAELHKNSPRVAGMWDCLRALGRKWDRIGYKWGADCLLHASVMKPNGNTCVVVRLHTQAIGS